MYKSILLNNGDNFNYQVVKKRTKKSVQFSKAHIYAYRKNQNNLYKCYAKPSLTKLEIADYWLDVCKQLNGYDFVINSYNSQFFTLSFLFEDNDGVELLATITPSYNYVSEMIWSYEMEEYEK